MNEIFESITAYTGTNAINSTILIPQIDKLRIYNSRMFDVLDGTADPHPP